MNKTELALRFGGKYGSKEYYYMLHTLNYVSQKNIPLLEETLKKIERATKK